MMTADSRARIETALGERYEIVRLLGRGGMGAVYLARERALDRLVALKVLLPEAESEQARDRFRREARAAARLSHPNIVPLYSSGQTDDLLYFVMGYVRGQSLADRLRQGPLLIDECRLMLAALADALDHAHRHGVVHRDVKPDNVLIDDESGRPMLTDFGIARLAASGPSLTESGTIVGTALYLSPEQIAGGRDVDGRSDIYSLGAVGFAMLTGRAPFEGEGFWRLAAQHSTASPPSIVSLRPDAPPDLAAAILRCLEKDPARRWQDGKSLREALGATSGTDVIEGEVRPLWLRGLRSGLLLLFGFTAFAVEAALYQATHVLAAGFWAVLLHYLPSAVVPAAALFTMALARAKRNGISFSEMRRAVLLPPRWWFAWWPQRWRPGGDTWLRLPASVRLARHAYAAFWVLFIIEVQYLFVRNGQVFQAFLGIGGIAAVRTLAVAVGGGAMALLLVLTYINRRHWLRRGLSPADAFLLLTTPTAPGSFWRRPEIATLLQSPMPSAPTGELQTDKPPDSPRDVARGVEAYVAQLAGAARELAEEAASSAWRAVAHVEALEKEIGVLARDADPGELSRLEERLSGTDAQRAAAAPDSDEQRQMFGLLEDQLALMRRLRVRREDAERRRDRVVALLRSLWLQVAELRARGASEALADSDVTMRIRAVCADLARQAAAEDELVAQRLPAEPLRQRVL